MQVYDGDTLVEIDDKGRCPKCDANWNAGDILETFKQLRAKGDAYYSSKTDEELVEIASYYGSTPENPKSFSRLIGVELPYDHPEHYDGVSFWRCPECQHEWQRFEPESKEETQETLQQLLAMCDIVRQELLTFSAEQTSKSEKQKVKSSLKDVQILASSAISAMQFAPYMPEDLDTSIREAVERLQRDWGLFAN